jgi:serine/threonine-protein kinase
MPGEPKKIGRYEVSRVLGHGAMGVVYLAFDPLLKRPLAIKTVREFGSDPEASLLRFQREAEISARLSHPNIVTVHDVGQDPEAGPFLAMEFIDGMPLSDLIQQGIPTESVIRLLLQGMSALQAAERAGITHRDVKPANILVSHDGRLKLMDFGIARGEGTRLTQTGQIMGTPSYTAPEALGGTEPSSVSDRYAFAVTAFQMLTRELPFECPTIAATLFRIAHEAPLFPESMAPALRAVFQKALAKCPEDRYADLAGFMGDLIAAVDLPLETRAKLLDGMAGDSGAEVAHLIKTRAETTISFSRELPTLATPTRPNPIGTEELATEAFRTPLPRATRPTAMPGKGVATVPHLELVRPDVPKRRTAWVWWAAAGLLAAGLLGSGALRSRYFLMDIASSPAGARVLLGGREIGHTDLLRARIPREGGTLRLELEGYEPQELPVRDGSGPVRLVLARPQYTVRVVTSPPGAEAWLNGVAQGTTPIQGLKVPADGRQELVLRLRDRRDWTRVLDRNTPLPDPIRLEPRLAAGTLPASTRPPATLAPSSPPAAPVRPVENRVPIEPRAPGESRAPAATRAPSEVRAPSSPPAEMKVQPVSERGRH